ncbi:Copper chaperone CopZ [Pirellula sp. SH-Sr6A]|uniref:heavy-metal-associated domain-containing protein n=1 Tax=Pirellula sp. SH-Sr6A TaxID=1632865 RepID=UPI00078DC916|nr:heavy-metal-associated domain-containing protein [Pirellula sp. SH-Sr6A]AMV30592.1 Copper chaperone CopZ [Pirellula sp. SH-Sr6A]
MNENEQTKVFQIVGMTCGHCKRAVESAIQSTQGVREVRVELDAGKATVTGRFPDDAIVASVEDAGYTATLLNA